MGIAWTISLSLSLQFGGPFRKILRFVAYSIGNLTQNWLLCT